MKILVLNCGSSSVKYQLFEMDTQVCLAKGMVSRIGMSGAVIQHKPHDRPEVTMSAEILDHTVAIENVVAILLSPNHGVIKTRGRSARSDIESCTAASVLPNRVWSRRK